MDAEWPEAVLAERNDVQLVAAIENTPTVLIGCVWGTDHHPSHYITDIAVTPDLQGQGLASNALQFAMH